MSVNLKTMSRSKLDNLLATVQQRCTAYSRAVAAASVPPSSGSLEKLYLDIVKAAEALSAQATSVNALAAAARDHGQAFLSPALDAMKGIMDASSKLREHITKVQLEEGGLTAPPDFDKNIERTAEQLIIIYTALHGLAKKIDPNSVDDRELVGDTNRLTNLTLRSLPSGRGGRGGGASAGVVRVVALVLYIAAVVGIVIVALRKA